MLLLPTAYQTYGKSRRTAFPKFAQPHWCLWAETATLKWREIAPNLKSNVMHLIGFNTIFWVFLPIQVKHFFHLKICFFPSKNPKIDQKKAHRNCISYPIFQKCDGIFFDPNRSFAAPNMANVLSANVWFAVTSASTAYKGSPRGVSLGFSSYCA